MGIRTVIQGRMDKLLGKGVELQLGSESLRFEAEDQLKAFLKSRANISAATLAELKEMPQDRLERHLQRNERIYKHTLGLLLQVVEHDSPVDMLWRDLDISELPDEQQWPAILFAVSSNNDLPENLKRESIERFVEFLRARRAMLLKLQELGAAAQLQRHQQTAEIESPLDGLAPPDDDAPEDLTGAAMTHGRNYQRVPGHAEIALNLEEDDRVNLYLSRWKISLCMRDGAIYVEEDGNSIPLKLGENVVGRSAACDIPVTNAPLDVSRKHVVVHWVEGGKLLLRDVSTKGTWLPADLISASKTTEATMGR